MEYKPIEKNLEEGMSQLGNQIRSMPHVIIGKQAPQISQNPTIPPAQQLPAQTQSQSPIKETWETKLKKWGLGIAVAAVICFAVYSLLSNETKIC